MSSPVDYKVSIAVTDNESLILHQAIDHPRASGDLDAGRRKIRLLPERNWCERGHHRRCRRGADAADATFRAESKLSVGPHDYFGPAYAILSPDVLKMLRSVGVAGRGFKQSPVFRHVPSARTGYVRWRTGFNIIQVVYVGVPGMGSLNPATFAGGLPGDSAQIRSCADFRRRHPF